MGKIRVMAMEASVVTTSLLEVDVVGCAAFTKSRALTETLAAPLAAEDQPAQSMPDASPTKWHRTKTRWFYEKFLLGPAGGYQAFDDGFRYLFNSYYEGAGPRHPRARRGLVTRPAASEIARYREHVEYAVSRLLCSGVDDEGAAVHPAAHHSRRAG